MALLGAMVLGGCTGKDSARALPPSPAGSTSQEAELALRVSDTVTVWFTSARADTAADGRGCLERVMEIRSGTRLVPVPLLYTGEAPRLTSDSTFQVHIWIHCAPADLYRVHLRTGQPTRAGP
jgi:hypothetical protein